MIGVGLAIIGFISGLAAMAFNAVSAEQLVREAAIEGLALGTWAALWYLVFTAFTPAGLRERPPGQD